MQEVELHIEQLKVLVNTNSIARGYELKDNLDTFIEQSLLPMLQAYLQSIQTQIAPERILEEIKIELKPSVSDFEYDVELQLREQLETQLLPLIHINSNPTLPEHSSNLGLNFDTEQQAILEFFKTGDFPWWYPKPNGSAAMEALYYKSLEDINLKKRLVSLARTNIRIKNRLIHQLPDGFLLSVSNATVTKSIAKTQTSLFNQFNKLELSGLRYSFWDLLLTSNQNLSAEACIRKAESLIELMVSKSSKSKQAILEIFTLKLINTLKLRGISQQAIQDFKQYPLIQSVLKVNNNEVAEKLEAASDSTAIKTNKIRSKKSEKTTQNNEDKSLNTALNKEKDKTSIQQETNTKEEKKAIQNQNSQAENPKSSSKKKEQLSNQNSQNTTGTDAITIKENGFVETSKKDPVYYAEHCGLLLLHPFLGTFLKRCELLDENSKITNKAAVVKLLYYTATGLDFPYEHQTVLEKFVADYPKGISIDRTEPLADNLKEKSDALLEAVLGHLPQLKSSSPALLRNEFLSRPGKLIINSNRTKIIVERKTQDLLLNQVPWNMALIKLPWLKNFIHLDW